MPFNEFCIRSTGNNMNAGTLDGSSTEVSSTPVVTYTNGGWNSGTLVYTVPAGPSMSEAIVGRWASLSFDGDSVPTTNQYLVGRIFAVNTSTREITIDWSRRAFLGSIPLTSSSGRTLRIGGAWYGPNGTDIFPMNLSSINTLTTLSFRQPRFNFKNDRTYSVTTTWDISSSGYTVEGYQNTYSDGELVTFSGLTSGASYVLMNITSNPKFRHCIFENNGSTGTSTLITCNSMSTHFDRCIFRNSCGAGFSNRGVLSECVATNCMINNPANSGAFVLNLCCYAINCIAYNNLGTSSTSGGFMTENTTTLDRCISFNNSGHGFYFRTSSGGFVKTNHCVAYSNGGTGFQASDGSNFFHLIYNCLSAKNGGWGFNFVNMQQIYLYNPVVGSGSEANTSGAINVNTSVSSTYELYGSLITLPANQHPFVNPSARNFSLANNAAASLIRSAGWSLFPPNELTTSSPAIGASQPAVGSGSGRKSFVIG